FVGAGFVAVCAQPFESFEAAGLYPYADEHERKHLIMQRIRSDVASLWDGTHLLISGLSHGATAPVLAIGRRQAFVKDAAVWMGSTHTAVVMFDGVSNPAALEKWAANGVGAVCEGHHKRFVGRYGDGSPAAHNCSNNACYCSSPPSEASWDDDTFGTIAGGSANSYGCADFAPTTGNVLWRFVACDGGPSGSCGTDTVPKEQQQAAFKALDGCANTTASFESFPNCNHGQCGKWSTCGGASALAWLEQNGW
ncbi:MAG: hypothetical protein VB934_20520, partial [Polyangiaceae bacterium]